MSINDNAGKNYDVAFTSTHARDTYSLRDIANIRKSLKASKSYSAPSETISNINMPNMSDVSFNASGIVSNFHAVNPEMTTTTTQISNKTAVVNEAAIPPDLRQYVVFASNNPDAPRPAGDPNLTRALAVSAAAASRSQPSRNRPSIYAVMASTPTPAASSPSGRIILADGDDQSMEILPPEVLPPGDETGQQTNPVIGIGKPAPVTITTHGRPSIIASFDFMRLGDNQVPSEITAGAAASVKPVDIYELLQLRIASNYSLYMQAYSIYTELKKYEFEPFGDDGLTIEAQEQLVKTEVDHYSYWTQYLHRLIASFDVFEASMDIRLTSNITEYLPLPQYMARRPHNMKGVFSWFFSLNDQNTNMEQWSPTKWYLQLLDSTRKAINGGTPYLLVDHPTIEFAPHSANINEAHGVGYKVTNNPLNGKISSAQCGWRDPEFGGGYSSDPAAPAFPPLSLQNGAPYIHWRNACVPGGHQPESATAPRKHIPRWAAFQLSRELCISAFQGHMTNNIQLGGGLVPPYNYTGRLPFYYMLGNTTEHAAFANTSQPQGLFLQDNALKVADMDSVNNSVYSISEAHASLGALTSIRRTEAITDNPQTLTMEQRNLTLKYFGGQNRYSIGEELFFKSLHTPHPTRDLFESSRFDTFSKIAKNSTHTVSIIIKKMLGIDPSHQNQGVEDHYKTFSKSYALLTKPGSPASITPPPNEDAGAGQQYANDFLVEDEYTPWNEDSQTIEIDQAVGHYVHGHGYIGNGVEVENLSINGYSSYLGHSLSPPNLYSSFLMHFSLISSMLSVRTDMDSYFTESNNLMNAPAGAVFANNFFVSNEGLEWYDSPGQTRPTWQHATAQQPGQWESGPSKNPHLIEHEFRTKECGVAAVFRSVYSSDSFPGESQTGKLLMQYLFDAFLLCRDARKRAAFDSGSPETISYRKFPSPTGDDNSLQAAEEGVPAINKVNPGYMIFKGVPSSNDLYGDEAVQEKLDTYGEGANTVVFETPVVLGSPDASSGQAWESLIVELAKKIAETYLALIKSEYEDAFEPLPIGPPANDLGFGNGIANVYNLGFFSSENQISDINADYLHFASKAKTGLDEHLSAAAAWVAAGGTLDAWPSDIGGWYITQGDNPTTTLPDNWTVNGQPAWLNWTTEGKYSQDFTTVGKFESAEKYTVDLVNLEQNGGFAINPVATAEMAYRDMIAGAFADSMLASISNTPAGSSGFKSQSPSIFKVMVDFLHLIESDANAKGGMTGFCSKNMGGTIANVLTNPLDPGPDKSSTVLTFAGDSPTNLYKFPLETTIYRAWDENTLSAYVFELFTSHMSMLSSSGYKSDLSNTMQAGIPELDEQGFPIANNFAGYNLASSYGWGANPEYNRQLTIWLRMCAHPRNEVNQSIEEYMAEMEEMQMVESQIGYETGLKTAFPSLYSLSDYGIGSNNSDLYVTKVIVPNISNKGFQIIDPEASDTTWEKKDGDPDNNYSFQVIIEEEVPDGYWLGEFFLPNPYDMQAYTYVQSFMGGSLLGGGHIKYAQPNNPLDVDLNRGVRNERSLLLKIVLENAKLYGWDAIEGNLNQLITENDAITSALATLNAYTDNIETANKALNNLLFSPHNIGPFNFTPSVSKQLGPEKLLFQTDPSAYEYYRTSMYGISRPEINNRLQRLADLTRTTTDDILNQNNNSMMVPPEELLGLQTSPASITEQNGNNARTKRLYALDAFLNHPLDYPAAGGQIVKISSYQKESKSNLKVFFIGIPHGTMRQFQRKPLISSGPGDSYLPGGPFAQGIATVPDYIRSDSQVISIKVYRRDFIVPDLVYEPISFIFDMGLYVNEENINPSSHSNFNPEEEQGFDPMSTMEETLFTKYLDPFTDATAQAYDFSNPLGYIMGGAIHPLFFASWQKMGGIRAVAKGKDIVNNAGVIPSTGNNMHMAHIKGAMYTGISQDAIRVMLMNHLRDWSFQAYYHTLHGITLDQDTFMLNPIDNWVNKKTISALGALFLQACSTDSVKKIQDPDAPLVEPKPSSLIPTGLSDLDGLLFPDLATAFPDPGVIPAKYSLLAENRIRRVLEYHAPGVEHSVSVAEYRSLSMLLESMTFSYPAKIHRASMTKEFERVFSIPVDIDDFIIDGSKNDEVLIQELLDKGYIVEWNVNNMEPNPYANVNTYKINRTAANAVNDEVFADQFYTIIDYVEQPYVYNRDEQLKSS